MSDNRKLPGIGSITRLAVLHLNGRDAFAAVLWTYNVVGPGDWKVIE